MKTIVFSDVDGTLLNDQHEMTKETRLAIHTLNQKDIPFVIVSARSPSGIYPILDKNDFNCTIIAYSGGLIVDKERHFIDSRGFNKNIAREILNYINSMHFDCTTNIYSGDCWLVNRKDQRVKREEGIVAADAKIGSLDDLANDATINKILCMCNPDATIHIEQHLKQRFHNVEIAKSSDILIEINGLGITKAKACEKVCAMHQTDIKDAIAFGDNYNDRDMLKTVGHPYLMGNAPKDLQDEIKTHTLDNNHDGIAYKLKELHII